MKKLSLILITVFSVFGLFCHDQEETQKQLEHERYVNEVMSFRLSNPLPHSYNGIR